MPFSITETPAAHAQSAPAAYYLAGSANAVSPRPGTFYVNTSALPTRRTYECEALALHEAIPGHHTQAAIQGENADLPDFRSYQEDRRYFEAPCRFPFYTGYIEGWGLHSETLGKELGLYENPSDQMGQLSMEALRSCRLVVDSGMHALGWSREKALDFMLQNTAMGEHDAQQEVARYSKCLLLAKESSSVALKRACGDGLRSVALSCSLYLPPSLQLLGRGRQLHTKLVKGFCTG
jgi:uncharacterized protein (DUF885 family)